MKKTLAIALAAFFCCAPAFSADNPGTTMLIDQLEKSVYGEVRTGSLVSRLDAVEKDLYGTQLQGTLAERQAAHIDFVEKGSNGQPSLLFKMSVAEWGLELLNNGALPLVARIPVVEQRLEGAPMEDRPVAMRVERVLGMVVSDPVSSVPVEVPAGTVARLQLMQTLKPAVTKKGDVVLFRLTHNIAIGNDLVVPAGSPAEAVVTSVKKPRSFGRPSEIKLSVRKLFTLGGEALPMREGDESKKATEFEASYAAAAGTSLVGALALGPLGLAGGFLVRGKAKDVPVGAVLYAETASAQTVGAYPVPESLRPLLAGKYVDIVTGGKVGLKKTDGDESTASSPAKKKESEIDSL
jgi:hypothetical protein